ncbi:MAG TPA: IPT/TIG domain-containing protein [Candidatus Binataceae bacterium]
MQSASYLFCCFFRKAVEPGRATRLSLALLFAFGLILLATSVSYAQVTYVYDLNGRLNAVVDGSNNVAAYQYDAVGNLLGISRGVGVGFSFVPIHGASGTKVTLFGSGFSTTASQDTVKFNGVIATITAANPLKLVVTVPSGASTGFVSVTTPSGSSTSAVQFSVP